MESQQFASEIGEHLDSPFDYLGFGQLAASYFLQMVVQVSVLAVPLASELSANSFFQSRTALLKIIKVVSNFFM